MPLPVFDTAEAVPEAFRSEYVEKDGKFVPKPLPDPSAALQQKNAELIATNKKLAAKAAVLGERTPEEIQADLDLAAKFKEEKLKADGNYEELKKLQATELAKRDEALKAKDALVYNLVGKQAAIEAITAAGGKPKKLLDVILRSIKVTIVDGEPVATVVDAKGNPRIVDGMGTPMTIPQLVEQFKADPDYAVDFAPSGASGTGARNDGGAGRNGGGTVMIPKDASPQEYRRLKDDAIKRGVPYAVAS